MHQRLNCQDLVKAQGLKWSTKDHPLDFDPTVGNASAGNTTSEHMLHTPTQGQRHFSAGTAALRPAAHRCATAGRGAAWAQARPAVGVQGSHAGWPAAGEGLQAATGGGSNGGGGGASRKGGEE